MAESGLICNHPWDSLKHQGFQRRDGRSPCQMCRSPSPASPGDV